MFCLNWSTGSHVVDSNDSRKNHQLIVQKLKAQVAESELQRGPYTRYSISDAMP